jgi:hypothetical protein
LDYGATDQDGDGCTVYSGNEGYCGNYNDEDFNSNDMCCACGGGLQIAYQNCGVGFQPISDSECELCPKGSSSNTTDSTYCIKCEANKFLATIGAVFESECQECVDGTVSTKGSSVCCPPPFDYSQPGALDTSECGTLGISLFVTAETHRGIVGYNKDSKEYQLIGNDEFKTLLDDVSKTKL